MDAELAAVVDPVVEGDESEGHELGHGGDDFSIFGGGPVGHESGVIEGGEELADGGGAVVVGVEDGLHGLGMGEEFFHIGDFRGVDVAEVDGGAGDHGDVQAEGANGVGFVVGFPGEFVVGDAFEEGAGDFGFVLEFAEEGGGDGHERFLFVRGGTVVACGYVCAPRAAPRAADTFELCTYKDGLRAVAFGGGADEIDNFAPAIVDVLLEVCGDEADGGVGEDEQGAGGLFGEAVLDVGGDGEGHHHRADDFEKFGWFDDLDVAPEVA